MAKRSTMTRVSDEFYQFIKGRAKIHHNTVTDETRNLLIINKELERQLGIDISSIPVVKKVPKLQFKKKVVIIRD